MSFDITRGSKVEVDFVDGAPPISIECKSKRKIEREVANHKLKGERLNYTLWLNRTIRVSRSVVRTYDLLASCIILYVGQGWYSCAATIEIRIVRRLQLGLPIIVVSSMEI